MWRNCYENSGGRRTCEGGVRQTERGGVADGDMLIYELQGFSLTILSFTETGGRREREQQRKAKYKNWAGTERKPEGEERVRENEI